jgi:DNA-directed RNA polymerase subunit RPC12/RpoP
LRCSTCRTNLEIDDDLYGDLAGKSVACPQCNADISIPPLETESASRKTAPSAAPKGATTGLPDGFARKTMKLDEMLENIPQAKALEEGKCPYCGTALNKMHDRAFLCKNCGRVIRMIRRTLK